MTIAKIQYEALGGRLYLPEGPLSLSGQTPFASFKPGTVVGGDAESEFVYLLFTAVSAVTMNQGDVLVWDNSFQVVQAQTGSGVHAFGSSVGTFFLGGNLDTIEEFAAGGLWSYTFQPGVYGIWVQRAGVSLMNCATINAQTKPLNTTAVNGQVNAPATALSGSMGITGAYPALSSWTFTANTVTGSTTLSAVSQAKGVVIGQTISGTGIPNGTYITDIIGATIIMSAAATATGSTVTITAKDLVTYGNTTNNSVFITGVTNIPGIFPNQTIAGTNISGSTTIIAITGGPGNYTIQMSAVATGTATGTALTASIYTQALLRWPQITVQN